VIKGSHEFLNVLRRHHLICIVGANKPPRVILKLRVRITKEFELDVAEGESSRDYLMDITSNQISVFSKIIIF
jgi:hypothetical protein